MAQSLRYTLLADGSSDRALTTIIDWLLASLCPELEVTSEFADLRRLPNPPRTLIDRAAVAIQLFPCDVLFVHRDAEREPPANRRTEIENAVRGVPAIGDYVPVVPVRMTEAWLLTDATAIRYAAGNPNGTTRLKLPTVANLETLADPKHVLQDLVQQAAEVTTRRRYRLRTLRAAPTLLRIAEETDSFAVLSAVPAFSLLQADVSAVVAPRCVDG